jgi:hypothetical protein
MQTGAVSSAWNIKFVRIYLNGYMLYRVVKTIASFSVFLLQKGSTGPAYAGNNTFTSWMNIKLSDHMIE